jgi:hypothetical protein
MAKAKDDDRHCGVIDLVEREIFAKHRAADLIALTAALLAQ